MILSILLFACDEQTVVGDDKGDGPGDTGDTGVENIGDTETGDTAETGDTGGETGDTALEKETTTVRFVLDGELTGALRLSDTRFGLVNLEPSDDGYTMGTVEYTAESAEEITIELPVPRPEVMVPIDGIPGLTIGFFVGGLFLDDGDAAWDADEGWVGVADEWTIYLDGVVPPEFVSIGLHEGWNALLVTADNPEAGDLENIALPVRYLEDMAFGGSADDTLKATDSIAILPASVFAGTMPAMLYLDEQLGEGKAWSTTLDGPPPTDHFADIDGDGVPEDVEIPYAYTDADNSGGISDGDLPLGVGCVDGDAVVGWWIEPPTDITYLIGVSSFGANVGWNALLLGVEGPMALVDDASASVVLSVECTLPE